MLIWSHTSSEEVNFEDEVQFPAGAEEAGTLSNSAAPCLNPAELTGNVSGKVPGNMSGNMSGNASGDGSDGLTGNESGGENQQPYQTPLSAGGERIQDSTSLLQPLLQDVNDSHLLTENGQHAVKGKVADIVNRLYLGSSNYRPIGADSSYATPLLPTTTAATTAPAHAATAVVHAAAATAQTAAAQAIAAVKRATATAAQAAATAATQATAAVQKATAAADRASVVHMATNTVAITAVETTEETKAPATAPIAAAIPASMAARSRDKARREELANNTALADQFNKPKGIVYNWADEDPQGEPYEETSLEDAGRDRDSQTVQILREGYSSRNKRSTTRRTHDENLVTTHSKHGLSHHNTDNGRGPVGAHYTENQISQSIGSRPCPICLQREKATEVVEIKKSKRFKEGGPHALK